MNWDDLRLFLAVARSGSISGAAKQLGIQHSTVSRRIRSFEEKMGVRLLERIKGGYELTTAGEQVKLAADNIEAEVLNVDGTILDKDQSLVGPVKVTAINNMASSILMPMFAAFSKSHPEVELHILVSNLDASLAQREADIAIRLSNSPPETLIGKRVVTVATAIYGSKNYLKNLQDTKQKPQWIGVECCGFHKTWTKQHCPLDAHQFISDDTLLTLSAMRQDLGLSVLPCFMGDNDPLLERYAKPDPAYNLGLWILMHPDLRRTARVLAFREHMIQSILEKEKTFTGEK